MVITHDPNGELTREKSFQYLLEELFLPVTPLNAELGSSLMSLMTIGKGLSIIGSPFQNNNGCTNGQKSTQPST